MKIHSYYASLGVLVIVLFGSNVALSQEMPPPFQSFQNIDLDLSGGISIDEANTYHIRVFALFEENRDGTLTRVEFIGKRVGPEQLGFCARETHDLKEKRFAAWEQNGDGRLSKAEFLSGALSCFARADQDGDSQLDEKEFDAGL